MKKLFAIVAILLITGFCYSQQIATVVQDGNYNTANVTQIQSYGASVSLYATQSGNYNVLNGTQTGDNNYYQLIQGLGNYNYANVDQEGVSDAGAQNYSTQTQSGNNNNSILKQGNLTGDPYGNANYTMNTAYAVQSGNNNSYNATQGSGWKSNNYHNLLQSGNYNSAIMNQNGHYEYSTLTQLGNYNYAELNQPAGGGTGSELDSYSYQNGNYNTAYISQVNGVNNSQSWQTGNNNYTNVYQWGYNSDAFGQQTGSTNTYDLLQK